MIYQLMYDRGAGEHYVNQWSDYQWHVNWERAGIRNQEGHYTEYGHYENRLELRRAISYLRGSSVYAVFLNHSSGEIFYSQEDGLSGNWRGSKYGHFNLIKEFKFAGDAEGYVSNYVPDTYT